MNNNTLMIRLLFCTVDRRVFLWHSTKIQPLLYHYTCTDVNRLSEYLKCELNSKHKANLVMIQLANEFPDIYWTHPMKDFIKSKAFKVCKT